MIQKTTGCFLLFKVIIFLIFWNEISAQDFKEISLRDIGFQKDIVLYGITPAQTFFFPIPREGIDFKPVCPHNQH